MALMGKGAARRRSRVEALERPQYGWIWKPLLAVLVLYLLVAVALGIWWSRTPAPVATEQATVEQRGVGPAARGAVTTAGLMSLLETLLDKPGGYLRNDLAPPGLWLDNMPAWELGVLSQARRLARALPAMTQSAPVALAEVSERLQVDSRDWFYPSTEHRLEQALSGLDGYLAGFGLDGGDGFAEDGRGLSPWLESVARSLDDLGLRLSASVGSQDELRDLDIEAEAIPVETPWYRVDNVFFEARGQAWALRHLLEAVRHDQADVLEAAGVAARWDALIVELERSQRRLWSPMVLNGSGFGLFANHSLVMANHVVRARDLARDLAVGLAIPVAVEASAPVEMPVSGEGDGAPVEGPTAAPDQPAEASGDAAEEKAASEEKATTAAEDGDTGEAPSIEAPEAAAEGIVPPEEETAAAEGEGSEAGGRDAPEVPTEH